jgi:hypothetical protein
MSPMGGQDSRVPGSRLRWAKHGAADRAAIDVKQDIAVHPLALRAVTESVVVQ